MDEPGAGWRGGDIGESGPVRQYPSRTGHHLLPPPRQPRGPACRRDTEVPAARRAQSLRGQAKSPRPRAPGRTHRAGQKPLRQAAGTAGRRDVGLVATHRSSCAPAGEQWGTHGRHSPGRDAPPGEPKGCIGASSRRFLVFLSPTVGVANSWEKRRRKKKKKSRAAVTGKSLLSHLPTPLSLPSPRQVRTRQQRQPGPAAQTLSACSAAGC